MKRFLFCLALLLLSIQNVAASDMTGALLILPALGGVVGLLFGAVTGVIMFKKRRSHSVWLIPPVGCVLGILVSSLAVGIALWSHQDKIVWAFGRYDHARGGMGVIQVPGTFSRSDLEQFYILVSSSGNPILSGHEYAAALVHQDNGIYQVYLNADPRPQMPDEYITIQREIERQMKIVLEHHRGKN